MSKSTTAAPPSTPSPAPATFEATEDLSEKHGPDVGLTSESEEYEATLDGSRRLLWKHRVDVEAQPNASREEASEKLGSPLPTEYRVSTKRKLTYLGMYFCFNLGLTIYNKAVLGKFAFPWLLTTLHATSASIGCFVLFLRGSFRFSKLSTSEDVILLAFSFLFTINIAISNVSLATVSVPFHQIMRSTCPIFTILIYRVWFSRSYSNATYLSLIPIMVGVALATYGDYLFTLIGFFLTLLGVILASLKTVATNRLMTGSLALPPLELLTRMSPLAAIQCLLYAAVTGESRRFLTFVAEGNLSTSLCIALGGNGLLAFLLNVSSFTTNKAAGALTMTVCANLKQCLTIVLGILLFDVRVGLLNGVGMIVTLAGAAWYSKVELASKGKK